MSVHLLHTARVHCEAFDRLRDSIAPGVEIVHHVHEHWLDRARDGKGGDLWTEIDSHLRQIEGPVLCTCSTIGPMAEAAGALRIDLPMMQAAAQLGGRALLVYCLDSTVEPSRLLLQRAIEEAGTEQDIEYLSLSHLWPIFEAGEVNQFALEIAKSVEEVLLEIHEITVVVLAQVSMAGAAEKLTHVKPPVLSSPKLALETLLALGAAKVS
ncbi:hypothetical protein [Roseovarius phycicola]|uniref:Arylsulfatase n=1 Tax=Roseovarius phycicola TaxID=3080976 RepID=A0ABZ2HEZ9_9RHOB